MLADVTFTVELDPEEAQVLQLVLMKLNDEQIAKRMGGKFSIVDIRKGLRLTGDLDLIDATRKFSAQWKFHDTKKEPAKLAGSK